MHKNIKFIVNDDLDLFDEFYLDDEINSLIKKYGRHRLLSAVLCYYRANHNIIVTESHKTIEHHCNTYTIINLIEHKDDGLSSMQLEMKYKESRCKLLKTSIKIRYDSNNTFESQAKFGDACKSSWVKNLLIAMS